MRGVNITTDRISNSRTHQKDSQIKFYNKRFSEIDRALTRLVEPNLSYDRRLMEKILDESKNQKDSTLLEICAGQGIEGILLSENASLVICSDISIGALKVAKDLAKIYKKTNIELIQCDAEFLPFRNNIFDLSFGKDALHHVTEPIFVLKEMQRCSKKFSKIIVIEANPLNPQMALIGLIYFNVDKGVFQNNENNLKRYFQSANLSNIDIKYAEFLPRSILFYVSSPLLKLINKYPLLNKLLLKINIVEQKIEKIKYAQKFSNFLIVSGTKR